MLGTSFRDFGHTVIVIFTVGQIRTLAASSYMDSRALSPSLPPFAGQVFRSKGLAGQPDDKNLRQKTSFYQANASDAGFLRFLLKVSEKTTLLGRAA